MFFGKSVGKQKNINKKVLKTIRFSTLYHLAGVQGLEPWARGFGAKSTLSAKPRVEIHPLKIHIVTALSGFESAVSTRYIGGATLKFSLAKLTVRRSLCKIINIFKKIFMNNR